MKKYILSLIIIAAVIIGSSSYAASFNAFQIATSTATTGFVPVSQGANVPAKWVATSSLGLGGGGGSGTVNSGTVGQAAFYNTSGTAVSGTSSLIFNANGTTNFANAMTVGGTDNRGILTVQKIDSTTFATNTDPTDTGRYFVMENNNTSNAANQFANVTLQINPTGSLSAGRVLGDIRLIRKSLNASDAYFLFSAFGGSSVYSDFAKIGLDSSYFAGNLGIGTTSPYAKLSVAGDLAVTGGIYDSNATRGTNGQVLQTTGSVTKWVATSTLGLGGSATTPATPTNSLQFNNAGAFGGSSALIFNGSSSVPLVQIGSTTPTYGYLSNDRLNIVDYVNDYSADNSYNLSPRGCATADKTVANDLNSTALNFGDFGHTSSGFTGIGCTNNPFTGFNSNSTYLFDPSGDMNFALGGGSGNFKWFTGGYATSSIKMLLSNAGNLGLGTTSPSTNLSVVGNGYFTGGVGAGILNTAANTYNTATGGSYKINGTSVLNGTTLGSGVVNSSLTSVGTLGNLTVTTAPVFSSMTTGSVLFATTTGTLAQDNSKFFWDDANFRLGIGTAAPTASLSVTSSAQAVALFSGSDTNNTQFNVQNTATGGRKYGLISTANANSSGGGKFAISDLTSGGNRFVIDSSGNVGIATSTPNSTLSLNGSLSQPIFTTSGNYTLTSSDYAVVETGVATTVTLPTAVGIQGRLYVVKDTSGSTITLNTTSSQTIFATTAVTSITLAAGASYTVQSDGSNWIAE